MASSEVHQSPTVEAVEVREYEVPTDQPEADGTLEWSSTTVVVVEVRAGGLSGLGWTYAGPGSATVVEHELAKICLGSLALDVPGLNERMARACRKAAGEYGYSLDYFAKMVDAEAVDCLQVDVTRCGGYTVWLRAAAVAEAHNLQVSGHCAPQPARPRGHGVPNLRHLEYFHDHHRIETTLFDGALSPQGGQLCPAAGSHGHGLSHRQADAEQFRAR